MMPREVVVYDQLEPCPYLDGQTARLPLRFQRRALTPADVDASLARGDRRVGEMLYVPSCPACNACEPLRVPVAEFVPTRSQKRVWKANQDLTVTVGPASCSPEKLALFNRHKLERGLARREEPMSEEAYSRWFVRSCVQTVELRYAEGDRTLAVSVLDLGARDASSVYVYFDPDAARRSLGTFSALFEIAWLRHQGGRFYYLGLYVADNRHISYKARFLPHERLIRGTWTRFSAPPAGAAVVD